MKPSEVIRGALSVLGESGENWHKGWFRNGDGDKFCVAGAAKIKVLNLQLASSDAAYDDFCIRITTEAERDSVAEWNDDPHTTFEDVRLVLKRALGRAEEQES